MTLALHQAHGRGMNDLEFRRHSFAHALDIHQPLRLGADDLGEGAEAGQELFRQQLGVAPADSAVQNHFQ